MSDYIGYEEDIGQIWYTSDPHYSHTNILEYCNRPFTDIHHMNTELSNRWNERVKPNDRVYIIGDFKMGDRSKTKEFADRLNGRKDLIIGNHDKLRYCSEAFDNVWTSLVLNEPIPHLLVHNPEDVPETLELYVPESEEIKYALVGHVHEKWAYQKRGDIVYINVGVDVRNYAPVTFEELIRDIPKEIKI